MLRQTLRPGCRITGTIVSKAENPIAVGDHDLHAVPDGNWNVDPRALVSEQGPFAVPHPIEVFRKLGDIEDVQNLRRDH
jgi:hypothetical protein